MISAIFAMDRNKGIGKNNDLPWRLPNDLKYFKKITSGSTIVMGRKTYESIGKPLPLRTNVVLTKDSHFRAPVELIIYDQKSIKNLPGEVFIIGGANLISQCMDMVDKLYLTYIDEEFDCDTFLNVFNENDWILESEEKGIKDEKNPYDYYFKIYRKK